MAFHGLMRVEIRITDLVLTHNTTFFGGHKNREEKIYHLLGSLRTRVTVGKAGLCLKVPCNYVSI